MAGNVDQGLGGYSRDMRPDSAYWGNMRVNWNSSIHRYQAFINAYPHIAYAESPDGIA